MNYRLCVFWVHTILIYIYILSHLPTRFESQTLVPTVTICSPASTDSRVYNNTERRSAYIYDDIFPVFVPSPPKHLSSPILSSLSTHILHNGAAHCNPTITLQTTDISNTLWSIQRYHTMGFHHLCPSRNQVHLLPRNCCFIC